jgi:hypothetical protein
VHRFKNVGTTTGRLLEWSLPGGMDRYFMAISNVAGRDGLSREQALEIGQQFDTTFCPGAGAR